MMRKLLIPVFVALGLVGTTSFPLRAEDKTPDALIAQIPAEVPEVVSGGNWNDGGTAGAYRAILVISGRDKDFAARVYLQWIAFKADGGQPQIVKTVAIKEVNDLRWQNGFIALGDADTDNEMTIIVTSYDPKQDKDVSLAFKAKTPGVYAVTEPPSMPAGPPTGTGGGPSGAAAKK